MREKSAKRGALGKGIGSLLGDASLEAEAPSKETKAKGTKPAKAAAGQVGKLPIKLIDPNPNQPRKVFEDSKLTELAKSLKIDGVLQPLIVTEADKSGRYMIVAGERRWRAAQKAGLTEVPAIIKDGASEDLLRLALIENIQRADLNPIEEAEAYASLISDYGLTQEQCADRVGKERSTVTNAIRLLQLPREIQDDILDARLTMGHGRALLGLAEKKYMLRARDIVVKKELSVRQTEALCKSLKSKDKKESKVAAMGKDDGDLEYLAENLRTQLHTKVKISGNSSRGKIEISYFSAAELERILKLMGQSYQ